MNSRGKYQSRRKKQSKVFDDIMQGLKEAIEIEKSRERESDLKHIKCISKIAQREMDDIEMFCRNPNTLEDFKAKYSKGVITKDNPLGITTHSCNTCGHFVSYGIENECLATGDYCFKPPSCCDLWECYG